MSQDVRIFWQTLQDDWARLRSIHLRDLFAQNPDRFLDFSAAKDDLTIDFSKERVDYRAWSNLLALAEASDVEAKRDAMFAGEHINTTEDRAVMHVALRASASDGYKVDGRLTAPLVKATLDAFLGFADGVRDGQITSARGDKFTDVVNIGIGGSDLGPVMAVKALAAYGEEGPQMHFFANVDGTDFHDKMSKLNPATTLLLIASKTFTTSETMTNAYTAKKWLLTDLSHSEVGHNLVALSTNLNATKEFGVADERVFGFWDWVGGRYSLCASIGLPLVLAVGSANFREMLDGFRDMDLHFKTAPLTKNLPILLALIGIWRRNIMGAPTLAIMPYDQRMERFPAYVQQMDMESNGKSINRAGDPVGHQTAPVIWGEVGTNAQHSFFQLLHQGTDIVPVDFLMAAQPGHGLGAHHELLMANFLAQSEALALGKDTDEVLAEMLADGVDEDIARALAPNRSFHGNSPSTSIVYKEMTPFALGRLVALYEHKVFVQGAIWDINSFDQWGVELGKTAAVKIATVVTGDAPISDLHPSTQHLLKRMTELQT
jgi:glucose-6-phosphate isomerase